MKWDAPVPEGEAYGALSYKYERRRADATAAGFAVLAALGPELVRAELATIRGPRLPWR